MAETSGKSIKHSLQRIGNGVAIALIALSLLAQCSGVLIAISGKDGTANPGLLLILMLLSFTIVPGIILAFIMFLMNAVRVFNEPNAKFKAAAYLAIALAPFIFKQILSTSEGPATPNPTANEISESEQFLKGRDWAKEKGVSKHSECPGELEFARGCRSYIVAHRQEQFLAGGEWAKVHRPEKASQCKGPLHFVIGCRSYHLRHIAKPKPTGQYRYEGMTTAECRIEVNANYETLYEEFIESGNSHGAASMQRRHWHPDLADCENYDKWAANKYMPKAYERLLQILEKMKTGGAPTDDEKAGMLKDFSEMSKISDQPYRDAYLEKAEEYFARLRGGYKEPIQIFPRISCEEYQLKIGEMIKLDQDRVVAMRALKRADGLVTNSAKHQELNQLRIDMLWDWKYFSDGAKAAGCEIKLEPVSSIEK